MQRRKFLASPMLAGAAAQASPAGEVLPVHASGDGVRLAPAEYAALLQRLAPAIEADSFSIGGAVRRLEESMAAALGKEVAVWVSTGTLANHLAIRLLAGEKRRVLVQHESHLFNDCGDCCQTLSGLHLVPLAAGRATFTADDAEREAERGTSGRVTVPIGALQVETPVRRKSGENFDFTEMRRVASWARQRQIGLHLDGARLFIASAYSGIPVRQYADLFDTVYVSMYKYFNAGSGAILAGPRSLLENLFHTRRMFGNGLNQVWQFAAVAQHHLEGFPERYARAVSNSEAVIRALQDDSRFTVTRVPNGTNTFFLTVRNAGAAIPLQLRAAAAGLLLTTPAEGRFTVQVNESWANASPKQIIGRLG